MATGKRFYWIKLRDTMLTSDAVDFLMSQKDGANYVVLYQLLCLKTINTNGQLARAIGEIIIPYDEEKIVRDTKWFSIDTVRVALKLFQSLGLIYTDHDGYLAITNFDEMVGSETDYAQKNRKIRGKKNQKALGSGHNVSTGVSGNVSESVSENVSIENRDKEIRDKEIEIRDVDNRESGIEDKLEDKELTISNEMVCRTKDVRRIIQEWNSLGLTQLRMINPDSPRGRQTRKRVNDYGIEAVIEAIGKIKDSKFLMGENKKNWMATYDWFIGPNNFAKVLEGNYDDRSEGNSERDVDRKRKWNVHVDVVG